MAAEGQGPAGATEAGDLLVYVTVGSREEAEAIGRTLVGERLAACANVLPGIRSFYRWEGRLVEDDEALLLLKTRTERFEQLMDRTRELHSYTVPAILALPLAGGNADYLAWAAAEVGGTPEEGVPGAE